MRQRRRTILRDSQRQGMQLVEDNRTVKKEAKDEILALQKNCVGTKPVEDDCIIEEEENEVAEEMYCSWKT